MNTARTLSIHGLSKEREAMEAAKAHARLHLPQCCREVAEWNKTGFLGQSGRLWEVAEILQKGGMSGDIAMAERLVCNLAIEQVATQGGAA